MGDPDSADERQDHSWFGERIQSNTGRIETPGSEADVIRILTDPGRFPSPVRPVGSRHSMTPCMSAEAPGGAPSRWGTLVDMTRMTRLPDGSSLRFETHGDKAAVTVPAGRTFIDVARELRQKNLQFRVNTELGPLTMGAAACGATKDSSFPGESGQVCHDVVGMRLIKPDGEAVDLRQGDPHFDALRCSYGLFGIVTEVTCLVFPLEHVSLEHEKVRPAAGAKFTPAELERHFRAWTGKKPSGGDEKAVFLYLFPYRDRIVAEMRRKPATRGTPREWSLRLAIRNHFWDMGAHAWERFARAMPLRWLTRALQDLFGKVLGWYLASVLRLDRINPVAQIVDFEKGDKEHRFTFSMWAFPEDAFPAILPRYFELCRKHEATFRAGLPHASYHIHQDTSSLLSYSRHGPVWTLDPISPENKTAAEQEAWKRFLEEFNEFCCRQGGVPLLNQTPYLTPEQVRQAFGERLEQFEAARHDFDPGGRMLNAYFAERLGTRRPDAPGRQEQDVAAHPARKNRATYDYIVVGSGAGGAPAAARLAEYGFRVLVLEQGFDRPSRYVDVPLLSGAATEEPGTATGYFVEHYTDRRLARRDPKYVEGKGILYPRGTGRIGGSTQVNVQVWVRADDADWERFADVTGDDFWRARHMRRLLQLVERCEYRPLLKWLDRLGRRLGVEALRNRRGHGFNGYIETTRARPGLLLKDGKLLWIAFKTLLYSLRLGGIRDQARRLLAIYDPNDDRTQGTEGLVYTPLTVTTRGRRSGGVRDRLLDVQQKHPGRLTVRTGAKVSDIVLDADNRAVGVRYTLPDGTEHVEPVGREVILAAGAFETPAILMRSGIGSREKLGEAGIGEPRLELPGVGEHLHDRYEIGVISGMKEEFALLRGVKFDADPGDPHYGEWIASGKGVYASNGVVIGFQMKSAQGLPDPDLYVFCLPASIRGYFPGYFRETIARPDRLTWLVLYENKGGRKGAVRLNRQDINGLPEIHFHYHGEDDPQNPHDSQPLVAGIRAARKVTESYARLVKEEVWPGAAVQSDEGLREAIESNSWGHHANGTARMGKAGEPGAVVDGDLKVIGASGIRVSDASVFPHTPGSFIVAAVVQIGEAAAIKAIAEAHGQDPLAVLDRIMRQT